MTLTARPPSAEREQSVMKIWYYVSYLIYSQDCGPVNLKHRKVVQYVNYTDSFDDVEGHGTHGGYPFHSVYPLTFPIFQCRGSQLDRPGTTMATIRSIMATQTAPKLRFSTLATLTVALLARVPCTRHRTITTVTFLCKYRKRPTSFDPQAFSACYIARGLGSSLIRGAPLPPTTTRTPPKRTRLCGKRPMRC